MAAQTFFFAAPMALPGFCLSILLTMSKFANSQGLSVLFVPAAEPDLIPVRNLIPLVEMLLVYFLLNLKSQLANQINPSYLYTAKAGQNHRCGTSLSRLAGRQSFCLVHAAGRP